jgi:hypothetical protein
MSLLEDDEDKVDPYSASFVTFSHDDVSPDPCPGNDTSSKEEPNE